MHARPSPYRLTAHALSLFAVFAVGCQGADLDQALQPSVSSNTSALKAEPLTAPPAAKPESDQAAASTKAVIAPAPVLSDVGISGSLPPGDPKGRARQEKEAKQPAGGAIAGGTPPRPHGPRDQAYFGEVKQRAAELAKLNESTREQRIGEIKRRHLGE